MRSILCIFAFYFCSFTVNADDLKVSAGSCKLEKSGEVIALKSTDAAQDYGVFAEGLSKDGYRVYLTENIPQAVVINFQAADTLSYAIVTVAKVGPTQIRSGISVRAAKDQAQQWLSCNLTVQ